MHRRLVPRPLTVATLAFTLAVFVAGLATTPAQAEDKRQAQVDEANQAIWDCFSTDGDPLVHISETNGTISVFCGYEENVTYCHYRTDGTKDCGSFLTAPPPLSNVGEWVIISDPVIDNGGIFTPLVLDDLLPITEHADESEEPARELVPTADANQVQKRGTAAPSTDQDQDQDTSHGKKGKNGKKGGKGRRK